MRPQWLCLPVFLVSLLLITPLAMAGNGNGNNGNGNGNGGPRPTPGLDASVLSVLASVGGMSVQWLKKRQTQNK